MPPDAEKASFQAVLPYFPDHHMVSSRGGSHEPLLLPANQGVADPDDEQTHKVPGEICHIVGKVEPFWLNRGSLGLNDSPCAKSNCYPRGGFVVPKGVLPSGFCFG